MPLTGTRSCRNAVKVGNVGEINVIAAEHPEQQGHIARLYCRRFKTTFKAI